MMTVLTYPLWAQALVTVGGALSVTLVLRWLSHQKWISPKLGRAREVANVLRQPTTTFVALMLALSGVEVIGELNRAGVDAGREAGVLERLHRDSIAYGGVASVAFGDTLTAYVRAVVDDEWPRLRRMQEDPATKALFEKLLTLSTQMRSSDPREQMWLNDIVGQLNVAADLRRARISRAQSAMPWIFYVVASGGSLIVLSLAALASPGRGADVIVVCHALVIGFAFLLVVSLDLPFSGAQGVKPDDFRMILDNIRLRVAGPG